MLDKTRFTHTQFVQGVHQAAIKVNSQRFKSLNVIDTDLFEIDSGHRSIEINLPIYIGFEILQNAKIRLLAFYYDFLLKYIHPSDINCILSDTDSIYIALTKPSIKDTVIDNKKEEFQQHLTGYCSDKRHPDPFLTRECCAEHIFQDSKFPNLFKVEWSGELVIALCSKTYIAVDEKQKLKISAKGINHASLRASNPLQKFWTVMNSTQPEGGINKGFRAIDGQMYTYTQQKQCLPYFYCKRYVHEDGIFTSCLDLTLCPVPKKYLCLQTDLITLSPDYILSFNIDGITFKSIRQAITYFKQTEHERNNELNLTHILNTTDEYELVKINRSIPNTTHWLLNYMQHVKKILNNRMEQNPSVSNTLLLSDDNKCIINADPSDKMGGCGENHRTIRWCPDAYLRGRNRIGEHYVLMRKHLRSPQSSPDR